MLEGQNCCLGRILSHFSSWLLEQTMKGTRDRGVIASTRILCGKLALAWPQGWKKPGFFLTQPSGFFGFLVFYIYICPEERVFGVFSVSRILLSASRL
jgi:hypothetical protein